MTLTTAAAVGEMRFLKKRELQKKKDAKIKSVFESLFICREYMEVGIIPLRWDRRVYTPKNHDFFQKRYRAKKKCTSQTIPPIGMKIGRNLLYSII